MHALTETFIRSSFANASRKEVKDMTIPDDLDARDDAAWGALDFLGWRDPKFVRRAYVVLPRIEGEPVGIALRQAEASPRSRAMCNWCRDVRLPNEVVFWSAKRTGVEGRRGGTIGILICRDFQCSKNVRNDPPKPYDGYDMVAARERRIDDLRMRVDDFAADLLGER